MIVLCVALACLTALIAQNQAHLHERDMKADAGLIQRLIGICEKLDDRIKALEASRSQEFDRAAFEELKTKVEGLRIAQGMRRG